MINKMKTHTGRGPIGAGWDDLGVSLRAEGVGKLVLVSSACLLVGAGEGGVPFSLLETGRLERVSVEPLKK